MTTPPQLSRDIWTHIFEYLSLVDVARAMMVCVSWWCQMTRSLDGSVVWKALYTKDFVHPDCLYNVENLVLSPDRSWRDAYHERHFIQQAWKKTVMTPITWRISDRSRVGTQQFSQKEGIYATGSTGGKIFLYDILPLNTENKPQHIITFAGHTDAVRGIQFDEYKLVSGSRDRTIRVWNKSSDIYQPCRNIARPLVINEPKHVIRCEENVNAIMFQGDTIAAGFSNGILSLINLETGIILQSVQAHNRWIRHIQHSEHLVMSGGADGKIQLWDVRTLSQGPVRLFSGHTDCVTAVQFYESLAVSGAYDKTVRVWDLSSGRCSDVLRYHDGAVKSLQYDRHKIVSGSGDCSVHVYDWKTRTSRIIYKTHGFVSSVRFSRDLLAISSSDATITMLKANSAATIAAGEEGAGGHEAGGEVGAAAPGGGVQLYAEEARLIRPLTMAHPQTEKITFFSEF